VAVAKTGQIFFGDDGSLQRMTGNLILVDGITMTMTSDAALSTEDYKYIEGRASAGFWPFFYASGSAGTTNDVQRSASGGVTITTTTVLGNPRIIALTTLPSSSLAQFAHPDFASNVAECSYGTATVSDQATGQCTNNYIGVSATDFARGTSHNSCTAAKNGAKAILRGRVPNACHRYVTSTPPCRVRDCPRALGGENNEIVSHVMSLIADHVGPTFAVALSSSGCPKLKCALTIAKCAKAAYDAWKKKDPSIILKCTSRSSICECLGCLPSTVGDWLKGILCSSKGNLVSLYSHGAESLSYDTCTSLGAEGHLSDTDLQECAPIVVGPHVLAMGDSNNYSNVACGCGNVCVGHCVDNECLGQCA